MQTKKDKLNVSSPSAVTTERRDQEDLLKAEALASLGQMLFGIAHNIGTPLNIISGYAEFLLMPLKAGDRGHKELSAILDQTRRIGLLLNEALDVARSGHGHPSQIDIQTLLSEALDLAASYFRRDTIKTQLTCATGLPLIYGEAPRLLQAFFSLLLNMRQIAAAGGQLEVRVADSTKITGGLSVKLLTTGAICGDLLQSFAPLFGDIPGPNSTIGLSLARHIFNEAHGIVTIEESEELGAAIVVHLPGKAG